jgi:hypothetical protein
MPVVVIDDDGAIAVVETLISLLSAKNTHLKLSI